MKNTLLTVLACVTIICLLAYLSAAGAEYRQATQEAAIYAAGMIAPPTLVEMNEYADLLGKPHMSELPWIDEQGRDIYEFQQDELERLGLEGYIRAYVEPYEAMQSGEFIVAEQ